MQTYLLNLDYRLFEFFNHFAGQSYTWDLVFVIFAEHVVFLLIAGLALFVLLRKQERARWIAALQALAAAFLGRVIFVSLIRIFFFRDRPFLEGTITQLVYHNALEGSFPSGHATFMFAMAFTLFFINWRWASMYFILALLSSVARVIVGVHFPFDILTGILVAFVATLCAKWVFGFCMKKYGRDPSRTSG